jgi:hypothetical protein
LVGHQPGSITRISVAVLTWWVLRDADSADITKARDPIRIIRSRTARTERDLNIFRIVHSTLIANDG